MKKKYKIAYARRSGKIEFSTKTEREHPGIAICPKLAWHQLYRETIETWARRAYDGKTLLVPGVPEAKNDDEAEEALVRFDNIIKRELQVLADGATVSARCYRIERRAMSGDLPVDANLRLTYWLQHAAGEELAMDAFLHNNNERKDWKFSFIWESNFSDLCVGQDGLFFVNMPSLADLVAYGERLDEEIILVEHPDGNMRACLPLAK